MKFFVPAALAMVGVAVASPVRAQEAAPLTYGAFEPSVTHLDLESCPEALAREGAFWRLSIGSDMVHVWVFEDAGDMKLVEVRSYGPDEYDLVLK